MAYRPTPEAGAAPSSRSWARHEGMREAGIEQGLEHERALLRRQAASRFGETAERLSGVLSRIADPETLALVSTAVITPDPAARRPMRRSTGPGRACREPFPARARASCEGLSGW